MKQAIALQENGYNKAAIKKLKEADGKHEIAIAADPELKLNPVAANVSVFVPVTTPETVKAERGAVDDLLETGDIRGARARLNMLRNNIVNSYVSLPVETYPDAIKRAVSEITQNNAKRHRRHSPLPWIHWSRKPL